MRCFSYYFTHSNVQSIISDDYLLDDHLEQMTYCLMEMDIFTVSVVLISPNFSEYLVIILDSNKSNFINIALRRCG